MTRDQIVTSIANKSKSLQAYAYKLCGDNELASDLLQEMYLSILAYDESKLKNIYQNNKQYILCAKIIKYNWFKVAKNKKKMPCVGIQEAVEDDRPIIPVEVQINQSRQLLGKLLWSLEKFDRTIFYLYAIEKTSIRKMAEQTKINRGIIYKSLCQSRKEIQENLNPQQKESLKEVLNLRL